MPWGYAAPVAARIFVRLERVIPRSRENPIILCVDDWEVVRDSGSRHRTGTLPAATIDLGSFLIVPFRIDKSEIDLERTASYLYIIHFRFIFYDPRACYSELQYAVLFRSVICRMTYRMPFMIAVNRPAETRLKQDFAI